MSKQNNSLIDPDDLRVVIKIISKNWYFFILLPAIAFAASYLYTRRLVDVYAAETQILVNSNESFDQSRVINAYSQFYQANNNISNQKRILTSYDLIKSTLDQLDFNVSYFIDGRLRVTELFGDAPFKVEVKNINSTYANIDYRFKVNSEEDFYLTFTIDKKEYTKLYKFGEENIEPGFIFVVHNLKLKEPNIADAAKIEYRFVPHNEPYLVSKYRSGMTIKSEEYTTILSVSVADEVVERAKMFLDSLSKNYIDYTVQTKVDVNENTLLFIDKQLSEIVSILDSIEFDLELYKESRSILDLGREEQQYFEDLTKADFNIRELELKLSILDALENYVLENSENTFLPPSTYILESDNFLTMSLEKLYELQLSKITGLRTYTEESRRFSNIDTEIDLIKKSLLSYISDSRNAFKEKKKEITKQKNYFESLIKDVPKSQREILNIQRKQQVNEKMYLFLLEKRANTIITRAAIVPESKIIQRSRSVGKIGPDRAGIMQKFILAGIVLAALITAIRFLFFSKIENVRELKAISNYPVLGGLPSLGSKLENRLVVNENPKSNVAESFRALRTNLQFLGDGTRKQVLLVSSAHPGEGKTFTSVNLATIFALAGKKTVILDFDMHRPKIHKTFGLENLEGISSILAKNVAIEGCIRDTQVENLKLITCGPVPPNASELILSEKVSQLIEYTRKNFDYVFVDTPPIFLISDSLQLMKLTDINLIVTNTNNATKQGVSALEDAIKVNDKKNVYFILNNIKQARWSYYYSKYGYKYGYNYGYAYGYGYGQDYYNRENEQQ